jgi:4-amino-4-deoxychorismate mutase
MSGLAPFRRRLDELDEQIVELLGERFQICREVALYKRENDVAMMQPDRVTQVRGRYLALGEEASLPADFAAALFELVIDATCKMEDELIDTSPTAIEDASDENAVAVRSMHQPGLEPGSPDFKSGPFTD